jgi:myo-inositol-1(or 4)-monophosphatase
MTAELDFAIETVREAGALIMSYFRRPLEIRQKGENDPVSTADLAADRFLRENFCRRYPEDGWLSEESPLDGSRFGRRRLWIVDPIDGTREFIRGIEQFSVSVALVTDNRPCVAVVYNPATEELFSAERNCGAFLNDKRIRVSRTAELKQCRMIAARHEPELIRMFSPGSAAAIGSIAYKMALIAAGAADVVLSLDQKWEWDVCAGDLLVQEAGGRSTDRMGVELTFGNPVPRLEGIVAANQELHTASLDWLAAHRLQNS